MTNLEVIQELYRAFGERDYDAFLELCTAEVEWIQNEGFPGGATHHGGQAVIDGVFKAFGNDWASFSFELEKTVDAGETIVVIGAYAGQHRETGKTFRAAAVHVYDMVGGKVRRFRQFTDTKTIWDAMS